ncbi:hypothetical protein Q5424_08165 [Conexibacter sp. JD483]|uniref:hypothetical protein n=1 Tax=unclassified Conexibacter TaxID=2627773 RepID=UPI00271989E5|nr:MULTISPECIES: hypothetical protein [unclassified Conexibacter]MDO8183987.1 hypothetical protein [Conexibacter sp. CPCC 205706]MDO8196979.1 hypothetical protein [Conexibacter sp. CPCC 205762]MDR9369051.1 hypothetical protein [Conexibacter sp. JD483]
MSGRVAPVAFWVCAVGATAVAIALGLDADKPSGGQVVPLDAAWIAIVGPLLAGLLFRLRGVALVVVAVVFFDVTWLLAVDPQGGATDDAGLLSVVCVVLAIMVTGIALVAAAVAEAAARAWRWAAARQTRQR